MSMCVHYSNCFDEEDQGENAVSIVCGDALIDSAILGINSLGQRSNIQDKSNTSSEVCRIYDCWESFALEIRILILVYPSGCPSPGELSCMCLTGF